MPYRDESAVMARAFEPAGDADGVRCVSLTLDTMSATNRLLLSVMRMVCDVSA